MVGQACCFILATHKITLGSSPPPLNLIVIPITPTNRFDFAFEFAALFICLFLAPALPEGPFFPFLTSALSLVIASLQSLASFLTLLGHCFQVALCSRSRSSSFHKLPLRRICISFHSESLRSPSEIQFIIYLLTPPLSHTQPCLLSNPLLPSPRVSSNPYQKTRPLGLLLHSPESR